MNAEFTATEAFAGEEEDFIVAGVACTEGKPPHYLTFQRSLPFGDEEDLGVHLEYDDQANSGYVTIICCSVDRERLRVELVGPIDKQKKYAGFDVRLRVDDAQWESLAGGLRKIFADREGVLCIG